MKRWQGLLVVLVLVFLAWLFWDQLGPRVQMRAAQTWPQSTATSTVSPLATPTPPASAKIKTWLPTPPANPPAPTAQPDMAAASETAPDKDVNYAQIARELPAQVSIVDAPRKGQLLVQYNVLQPGESLKGYVVFLVPGKFHGRIVCDDICTSIRVLRMAADGKLHPVLELSTSDYSYYGPRFDYKVLPADEQKLLASLGVNIAESEILAQHVLTNPIELKQFDVIEIAGRDDPALAVNKQIYVDLRFE